jgi:hypothetical protein
VSWEAQRLAKRSKEYIHAYPDMNDLPSMNLIGKTFKKMNIKDNHGTIRTPHFPDTSLW